MTNKYMYFIANWKMFGSLNTLNSLHKVNKFFKSFKKNKFAMLHGRKYYFPISKNSSLIVKNNEDLLLIENLLKQKNKTIEYDKVLKS